jgi:transcriptional regulator with XRE-family HTH domain
MALRILKNEAIKLRKKGKSYSQIKTELGISKSTLSGWLSDMPLTASAITALQKDAGVIEKIRQTKLKNRAARLHSVYEKVSGDIGSVSTRELFIAGFFLYWAEGAKTTPYAISLSNTDPEMIVTFVAWLTLLKVPKDKIIVRLHLYADMDSKKEIGYWVKNTGLSIKNFKKSYVKKSNLSDLTYISRGHGTCNAIVYSRDVAEYIHQGLTALKSKL